MNHWVLVYIFMFGYTAFCAIMIYVNLIRLLYLLILVFRLHHKFFEHWLDLLILRVNQFFWRSFSRYCMDIMTELPFWKPFRNFDLRGWFLLSTPIGFDLFKIWHFTPVDDSTEQQRTIRTFSGGFFSKPNVYTVHGTLDCTKPTIFYHVDRIFASVDFEQ